MKLIRLGKPLHKGHGGMTFCTKGKRPQETGGKRERFPIAFMALRSDESEGGRRKGPRNSRGKRNYKK